MVSDDRSKGEHEIAADLRLHPERPPVTRSCKVLIGLAAVAIIAVLGAVIWAFDSSRDRKEAGPELYNTEHKTTADELAKLPRDYTGLPPGVPQLGPPLPGDLGRPMLKAQGPQGGANPEQQRVAQETEAALTSRLFTSSTTVHRAPSPPASTATTRSGTSGLAGEGPPIDAELDPEHAGSQARVPQCTDRQAHGQRRAAGGTGLQIYRAGRIGDPPRPF